MESKIFVLFVVVLLAMGVIPFAALVSGEEMKTQTKITQIFEKTLPKDIELVRTPNEVLSWQPAIIFAKVPGNHSVTLDVEIQTELYIDWAWPGGEREWPWTTPYSTIMIPAGFESDWYVTSIPGLFNMSVEILGTLYEVSNSVSYTLVVDSTPTNYSGSYEVQELDVSAMFPPILYAVDYNVLNDTSILEETLGLGPKGWTVDANQQFKTLIFAMDNTGFTSVNDITFNYCVNDGGWQQVTVEEDTGLMGAIEECIGVINDIIGDNSDPLSINHWLPDEWDLPTLSIPLLTATATIPGQSAGSYIEFYANATDEDDNIGESPIGFYYVDNEESNTKILSIDPNLYLWLFQENLQHFANTVQNNSAYQIPSGVTGNLTGVNEVAGIIEKYGIVPFRHWEYLGGDYDLYITRPAENVKGVLDTFQPDVIFLSNLWLGAQGFGSDITVPWNWDLNDIDVDGETLMEHIIDYTKNNHAGLIATHGTLSDWKIWLGPSEEEQYKIGTRGHVGDSLSDINVLDEKTIAAMLGMPGIALWEYGRDTVAQQLCELGKELSEGGEPEVGGPIYALGLLIGSTPLQLSYIPFSGSMQATPEAEYIDWNIPNNFEVQIPKVYNEFGFNAYTQVGWQLGMPRAIAYAAWQKALEALPEAQKLYEKLSNLSENITNEFISYINITTGLDTSLTSGLEELYHSLISANIAGYDFNLNVNLSKFNADISEFYNLTINLAQQAYEALLQFIPTRLVAMSDNGLAGIITHDKYWNPNGYRSIYFSFEIEVATGTDIKNLLKGAVEWAKSWEYQDVTELLGGVVRVENDLAQSFTTNFTDLSGSGEQFYSLLLNEEGITTVDLYAPADKFLSIIVTHPTTDKINATVVEGNYEEISKHELGSHLTEIIIKTTGSSGNIKLGFTADADSSINPAYVGVKVNEKPTVSISQPSPNALVSGVTTILGIADDTDGCIEGVMVCVDDEDWQIVEGAESWWFSWDTIEMSDGVHRINVMSVDTGDGFSDSAYVDVIVDNTPPTGTMIINDGATYATGTSISLTIDASDTNGVAKMIISNNPDFSGASWESYDASKEWELLTGDMIKIVYIKFKDNAGVESQTYSNQIILDTTLPTVTIVEKSKTTHKNSFTMSWSTTANDIQYYEISTNGNTWTNIGTTTSHTFTLSKGANTLYVRGVDNAGNTGSSESYIVMTYKLEEKGFIPAFETTTLLLAMIGVCIVLLRKRRR